MRKVLSLVLVLCMGACLVACGCGNSDYKEQKVTYKGLFEVTCVNDEIICDKDYYTKPDNLIITLEVENIGKKDEVFANYSNIIASQDGKGLNSSFLKGKNGKPYGYNSNKTIKKGDTATIKYAWQLDNPEDDVIVSFNGYMMNSGAGKMTFKVKGRQTKENINYAESSKKEYESKQKIKEGDLENCKVTVPKGWTARSLSSFSISMEKNKKKDEPSNIISVESHTTKVANTKSEAENKALDFKMKKSAVKEYKVAGKTFYGVEPTEHQFYLFGKASNGQKIVIDGMGISYKKAKGILNKNIKVK